MNDFFKANKIYISLLALGIILFFIPSLNFGDSTEERFIEVIKNVQGVGNVEIVVNYGEDGKVEGAVIVAEGAGNSTVKKQITDAAATAFGVSSYKIQVLSYKQEVK
ncbi:MAG: hypothetical protein IJA19_00225 [Clostridia bacterium]|nr:hypothetical protein [Clostridia bacterium]